MATVKKNNKKKIIIPICIVLVIAIIATSVIVVKANTSATQVSLSTITTGSIVESVNATGDVSAGAKREYKAATVATCKEVFVKVGDNVKKGDKLATFNTDSLDGQITSLENTYNNAKVAYNSAAASQKDAKAKLAAVEKQISALEKQMANVGTAAPTTVKKTTTKKAVTTAKPTTQKPSTTKKDATTTKPSTTTTTTEPTTAKEPVTYPNTIQGAVEALTDLVETITDLSDDIKETNEIIRVVMNAIADQLANNNYSPDAIAKAVGDAMADAIQQGIIDETKLIVDSGIAIEMVETAVRAVDWTAMGAAAAANDNVQLSAIQLQLTALYAQKEIYSVTADSSMVNAQRQIMDSSKRALDVLKESQSELSAGWIASMDGVITECNLEAGVQTSALSTGIKLENTDKLIATISLGEYDIHKVKIGMAATITTAFGSYKGEIATIAPTATGGSSGSILDSVGSMAGISGLSSLTDTGAGVECTVTIDDPDENIIIGFDANVEIQTGDYENVPVVPSESIILEKEGTFVYKYNEDEGTVTKTQIQTGATSVTSYQIIEGLSVGDKIVSTPASDYEDETFKVKVVDKTKSPLKAE